MRGGRPPGLARAPCSRVRSWRIGWVRMSSSPTEISTVLADDGDLDLAAPELVADPVVGAGEAHVAGRVDLAGHRRRRSRGPRRGRAGSVCPRRWRCGLVGGRVAAGVGGDEHTAVVEVHEAAVADGPRRSHRPATPRPCRLGREADPPVDATRVESRSASASVVSGRRPSELDRRPVRGWRAGTAPTAQTMPMPLMRPVVVVVCDPRVELGLGVGDRVEHLAGRGTRGATSDATARPCRSWSATAAR